MKSNKIKYVFLSFLTISMVLSYQNCGDVSLSQSNFQNSLGCIDTQNELRILDTVDLNTHLPPSIISGEARTFRVYELSNSQLSVFTPNEQTSLKKFKWYVDGEFIVEDVKMTKVLSDSTACRDVEVKAVLNLCGEEKTLSQIFRVGSCSNITCNEYGVSAEHGEEKIFYKLGGCNGDCDSITRRCNSDGSFGPSIEDPLIDVTEYGESTCILPPVNQCPTPIPTPGGGGASPTVSCEERPLFGKNQAGFDLRNWQRLLICWQLAHQGFQSESYQFCDKWSNIWPGGFLSGSGNPHRIANNRSGGDQFLSLEFNTNGMQPNSHGRFEFEDSQFGWEWAKSIITISKCPGDFNAELILQETGCYFNKITNISPIRWGSPTSDRTCKLEPNKSYYFNIVSTSSHIDSNDSIFLPHPADIQTNCASGVCGFLISPRPVNPSTAP